jgi:hypothetical protein
VASLDAFHDKPAYFIRTSSPTADPAVLDKVYEHGVGDVPRHVVEAEVRAATWADAGPQKIFEILAGQIHSGHRVGRILNPKLIDL